MSLPRHPRFLPIVIGAAVVLSGCSNAVTRPSTSPTPTTASTTPTDTPTVEVDFAPTVADEEAVFAVEMPTDNGAINGVAYDGDNILVYQNDLPEITHTVTGYSLRTGEKLWDFSGAGWIECDGNAFVVCETLTYEQGNRVADSAVTVDLKDGTRDTLDVGKAGTFALAAVSDDTAYFLTWQGTRDVHMTGFDAAGAPVADRNLRLGVPSDAQASNISTALTGSYINIGISGVGSGVYSIDHNVFFPLPTSGPCVAVSDGVVCAGNESAVGLSEDGQTEWELDVVDVQLLESAAAPDVNLSEARQQLLELGMAVRRPGNPVKDSEHSGSEPPSVGASSETSPGDSESSAADADAAGSQDDNAGGKTQYYALATADGFTELTLTDGTLAIPDHELSADIAATSVVSADFTRVPGIINVIQAGPTSGEASGTAVHSSILIGENWDVLARFDSDQAGDITDQGEPGEVISPYTFLRSGDLLIFVNAVEGVVVAYR
ncbi:hypothetical protein [Actinobaculum sp. 313]|uniref:hypothetical protein n=1 Tax=Actinobaculum sp. 313 TaxID=2495645 RepID=UPI000D527BCB|nr:hypothetical protein [Actinobaculum sp. 313]AWE41474.1 hypothetical protein DDD63_00375 [Actinobaculum sp. 313]